MKYRRLSKEELQQFPEEFAMFLAAFGVDKPHWDEMKSKDDPKANEILDEFSDLIFEKALMNCQYLEKTSTKEWVSYFFGDESAEMIALISKDPTLSLDAGMMSDVLETALSEGKLELVTGSKKFQKLREQEMFTILEMGGYMADENLYNGLKELL